MKITSKNIDNIYIKLSSILNNNNMTEQSFYIGKKTDVKESVKETWINCEIQLEKNWIEPFIRILADKVGIHGNKNNCGMLIKVGSNITFENNSIIIEQYNKSVYNGITKTIVSYE